MSDKSTEQKYFVGNWLREKRSRKIIALVIGISKSGYEYVYDVAYLKPDFDAVPFMLQSDLEQFYEVVPYPWQLFFKVGDKVKCEDGQEGEIIALTPDPEVPIDVYRKNVTYGYAPHELIKIGE